MNILMTGSTGFIGKNLMQHLLKDTSFKLRRALRKKYPDDSEGLAYVVGDINSETNWEEALFNCDVVIHLAARVHVLNETALDPLREFRRVNLDGTLHLAREAALAGVKRFIFVSSIKVNGESTHLGKPFFADDRPLPTDPYAISKYEAELGLQDIAEETGMEVVIIRPPLVYGPGVKGNFQTLIQWLNKGIPLPFGSIQNKRSFVAIDNLIDVLTLCITHPNALNQVFLVSDGMDLSTRDLLKKMGSISQKPVRLLFVPVWFLTMVLTILGKKAVVQRLCDSLQVDITKTQNLLNWVPRVSVEEALLKVIK